MNVSFKDQVIPDKFWLDISGRDHQLLFFMIFGGILLSHYFMEQPMEFTEGLLFGGGLYISTVVGSKLCIILFSFIGQLIVVLVVLPLRSTASPLDVWSTVFSSQSGITILSTKEIGEGKADVEFLSNRRFGVVTIDCNTDYSIDDPGECSFLNQNRFQTRDCEFCSDEVSTQHWAVVRKSMSRDSHSDIPICKRCTQSLLDSVAEILTDNVVARVI